MHLTSIDIVLLQIFVTEELQELICAFTNKFVLILSTFSLRHYNDFILLVGFIVLSEHILFTDVFV